MHLGADESVDPGRLLPARMLNEFTYCPRLFKQVCRGSPYSRSTTNAANRLPAGHTNRSESSSAPTACCYASTATFAIAGSSTSAHAKTRVEVVFDEAFCSRTLELLGEAK